MTNRITGQRLIPPDGGRLIPAAGVVRWGAAAVGGGSLGFSATLDLTFLRHQLLE